MTELLDFFSIQQEDSNFQNKIIQILEWTNRYFNCISSQLIFLDSNNVDICYPDSKFKQLNFINLDKMFSTDSHTHYYCSEQDNYLFYNILINFNTTKGILTLIIDKNSNVIDESQIGWLFGVSNAICMLKNDDDDKHYEQMKLYFFNTFDNFNISTDESKNIIYDSVNVIKDLYSYDYFFIKEYNSDNYIIKSGITISNINNILNNIDLDLDLYNNETYILNQSKYGIIKKITLENNKDYIIGIIYNNYHNFYRHEVDFFTHYINWCEYHFNKNNFLISYNHSVVNFINEPVVVTDNNGIIHFINNRCESFFNIETNEVNGLFFNNIFNFYDEKSNNKIKIKNEYFKNEKILNNCFHDVVYYIDLLGVKHYFKISITNFSSSSNLISFTMKDITQSFNLQTQILYQSHYDILTNLYNKKTFNDLLETAIKLNQYNEQHINGLLLIDIDNFRVINDKHGSDFGDCLLKNFSTFLNDITKDYNCTKSRINADEFIILIENVDKNLLINIGESIINKLNEHYFIIGEEKIHITASIGALILDKQFDTVNKVLSSLSVSCKSAKKYGKNRLKYFDFLDVIDVDNEKKENSLSNLIRKRIKDQGLSLYYQLIHNNENNHTIYIEILNRLVDENNNIISPNYFIPIAEKHNLIYDFDLTTIELVFKNHENYIEKIKNDFPSYKNSNIIFNINLSGNSISQINLLQDIISLSIKYEINPTQFCFEITETVAITNFNNASKLIQQLNNIGFNFALDDFGAGCSSFTYLKNLPVNLIKIDGNFIINVLQDKVDQIIVEAIVRIAKEMNIKLIAESIENENLQNFVINNNIQYSQGFWIHKPQSLD